MQEMWVNVPQVLSGTERFSLSLRALKALGLVYANLSLYGLSSAMAVGVRGRRARVAMVEVARGSVSCLG